MWCFFQNANYIFHFYFHNASVKGGKIMETNISTVQVVLMGLITVFVVLICLIVIIKILGLIMEKVAKKQPAPAVAPGRRSTCCSTRSGGIRPKQPADRCRYRSRDRRGDGHGRFAHPHPFHQKSLKCAKREI